MEQPKIEVALADDHGILRAGLIALINSFSGFTVTIDAADGHELLDKFSKADRLPEICILDVSMPGLNGYETIKILKNRWPDIKVLILTMMTNEYTIINFFRNGASGYLLKGTNPKELHKALIEIHNGNIYSSELVTSRFYKHVITNSEKNLFPNISEKELQFLALCTNELTYADIAKKMGLSVRTVEGYRDSLFSKLQVSTRTGLVLYALKIGLVSLQ